MDTPPENNQNFDPQIIKDIRLKLGISQEKFAHKIGVTANSVYRWESGKGIPKPQTIREIMKLAEQDISNDTSETDRYPQRYKNSAVNITLCRFMCKLTQEKLAEELGVSLKTVKSWEASETKPSQFYVDKIIKKLIEAHPDNNLPEVIYKHIKRMKS